MAPPFIPYYIDYNVKNQSKTIGVSKKKITFKFGFANLQAVDDGLVGAHCRGSEHEIVFTWSLNSGKRHVTLDGKDVHFSTSGQNGWTSDRTWQHVFSLKVPNYSGTFRCHLISQPAPQGSNIRPFDLRVGGVSIFKFNQIYQLGTPQMTVRKPGGSRANYGNPDDEPMSAEERRMLAAAKAESMSEFRKQQERESEAAISKSLSQDQGDSKPAPDADLLMSFDGPPAPAPPMPGQQPPGQMVSSMTLGSEFGASTNSFPGGMPPGQQPPYGYPQQQPQQSPYGYPQQQQQQQPNYGQPPPQQQQPNYGQGPYGAPFGSPSQGSAAASYGGSATTAPTANTSALTPYQAPPGQAQAPAGYSLGSSFNSFAAPPASAAPAPPPNFAALLDPYAKPPADPWATPAPAAPPAQAPSSYGQDPSQQQYGGYGQSQSSFQQMQSPGGDTQASFGTFGSAPDFARPPQAQQQQYQYNQQGYGQQQSYGQPPATPGNNPYAPPPQYQQQQPFGF